jgi:hypothetical protein
MRAIKPAQNIISTNPIPFSLFVRARFMFVPSKLSDGDVLMVKGPEKGNQLKSFNSAPFSRLFSFAPE